MKKGAVTTSVLLSCAGITFGLFGWTFNQFQAVNAHAAITDQDVARLQQKADDIDDRLIRIENKLDNLSSNHETK